MVLWGQNSAAAASTNTDALADDFTEKSKSTTTSEYGYDAAGNMNRDDNKGISSITYNYLNLPVKITFANGDYLEHTYDGTGRKLQVKEVQGGSLKKTTQYAGGLVYQNQVLQFVPTAEGRVLPTQVSGQGRFVYEYHYKDHLGNLRVAFQEGKTYKSTATMETSSASSEEAGWSNVASTRSSEKACTGSASAI